MARINDHYLKLAGGYLFPEIGRRVRAFQEKEPSAKLIRLGIGDVVLPIGASIRAAMHRAIDEMGAEDTFKGYGPDQGYDFLRDAIVEHDYKARGATVSPARCSSRTAASATAGTSRRSSRPPRRSPYPIRCTPCTSTRT
jgi:LL-diaminopimelate aminotransferase